MKIFNSLTKSAFLFSVILTFTLSLAAQTVDEGKALFTANCTACHSMKDRIVGPALKDAHKRHDEAWMIKWIKNSQNVIKSGDPVAVKLLADYNGSVMTAFENLSEVQIKSVIAYIKAESENPTVEKASADAKATSVAPDSTLVTRINWLLVIIVILLIWVISLVFSILSRISDIQGKPVINWNFLNSKFSLVFFVVGMIAVIWEFYVHGPLTVFNEGPASAHGINYDNMFMITLVLTGIVFVITQALLFWYGFKYKSDGKRKALYYPDNHKIEFWWTIVPAVVLTILVIKGLITWTEMTTHSSLEARRVEVFGYQFNWATRYAGADNKLGNHDFRQVGKINLLGVDTNDSKSFDDIIVSNELHFEVNTPVILAFRAKDVIHSAYMPHFRVQMNVVPGLPTYFAFTPTVTTREMRIKMKKPGFDYILLCNKICGAAHYNMKMKVVVETKSEYESYLKSQSPLVASKITHSTKAVALK